MAYTVTHTNGDLYANVGEGMLDESLGIALIGQNYHNYGQLIANNFLHLLEHQADDTPPPNPQQGQLWWDTAKKVLHYFDGNRFKSCSSSEVAVNPPIKPLDGDQWWDLNNHQLCVFDGSEWLVIGPGFKRGQSFSGTEVVTVTDTESKSHVITLNKVDGEVVSIANKDMSFIMTSDINGIKYVGQGITMQGNGMVTGTALNATQLGGAAASDYVKRTDTAVELLGTLKVDGASGITVGNLTVANDHIYSSNVLSLSVLGSALTLSNGKIEVNQSPVTDSSVATKLYVDTLSSSVETNARSYIDSRFAYVIGSSPIPTLAGLSNAINNDPLYHVNVSSAIGLKANTNNAVLTGVPQAPTVSATDSSDKIATTHHVKAAIDAANFPFTSVNTQLTSVVDGHVLTYANGKWVNKVTETTGVGTVRVNLTGAMRGDTGVVAFTNNTIVMNVATTLAPATANGGTTSYFKVDVNNEGRIVTGTTTGIQWTEVLGKPAYIDALAPISGLVGKSAAGTMGALSITGQLGQIYVTYPTGLNPSGVLSNPVISLANTTVTPGDYGRLTRVQVDQQGRFTGVEGTSFDPGNPLNTSVAYAPTVVPAWWSQWDGAAPGVGKTAISVNACQWDGTTFSTTNAFIPITSAAYRNHPLYYGPGAGGYDANSPGGWYGQCPYASTVCTNAVYEFKTLQTSRIYLASTGSVTELNGVYLTNAFYVKIESYNPITATWVVEADTDDGLWSKVYNAGGALNGYVSVSSAVTASPNIANSRTVSAFFPGNSTGQSKWNDSTNAYVAYSPLPALRANVRYRMTVQVYALTSSQTSLTQLGGNCKFWLMGE